MGAALLGLAGCGVSGTVASGAGAAGTATPGAPVVTPGPQAHYLRDVVTARGVTQDGAPLGPTAHFLVGMPIYVVCRVEGVLPGQAHRLTVRWYLHGQLVRAPGAYRYATVTQDGPLTFQVTYPAAGEGMVRLYWDEPVSNNSDRPNDHFLAYALAFTVQASGTSST